MGKRGPKPTPTKELKLRGSWLINNRTDEPDPGASVPTCPIWVKGEAKKEWNRIVGKLAAIGMLTELDRAILVDYCMAWKEYAEVSKKIESGEYKDKFMDTFGGGKTLHPALKLRDLTLKRLNQAASHFGLSPACRVGLKAQPVKNK